MEIIISAGVICKIENIHTFRGSISKKKKKREEEKTVSAIPKIPASAQINRNWNRTNCMVHMVDALDIFLIRKGRLGTFGTAPLGRTFLSPLFLSFFYPPRIIGLFYTSKKNSVGRNNYS